MKLSQSRFLIVTAILSLAACGPLQSENGAINLATGLFTSVIGAADSDSTGGAPTVTRAQIDAQDVKFLSVGVISRDVTALVFQGAVNGTKITWLSEDGLSLTFDQGYLVATRGFGPDLMGADVSGTKANLRNGSIYPKTLDYLDGRDQIDRQVFACSTAFVRSETITIFERSYATNVFEESCTSGEATVTNIYWQDSAGKIWQSRQWVSSGLGYLSIQRL